MMLLKRFRTVRRSFRPGAARTVSLPIHPCVELQHLVIAQLTMYWDGEFSEQAGQALIDELYRDPATATIATQVTNDEILLRTAFKALNKSEELTAA